MAIERLTIANYDNLENKPIAAKNLATETVEDGNYYLNKAAEKLVYTENPTNPDGSTIDKIYYNTNMSVDDVGQGLIDMPWDTALVQDVDGTSVRFLQLVGADTAENGGRGVYATKMTMPGLGDLYYIMAGLPSFDSEPQLLLQYSADFGPNDMDSGVPAWGWMDYETFELATTSPLAITESFVFNYMANKECWDTWFSTSNEFASSFDFEANTIYKRVGKAYKKIDGNILEPVDKLPQPTEALKGRVVYNKKDNQIYECDEVAGATTTTPISYELLLPTSCEWDSCSANTNFFVNDSIDADIVKAIFADKDSGTLITAYDSCNTGSAYVSYQHSGNELKIIDYTDSCSPRTIFDSAAGGWQVSTGNGWYLADSCNPYPRYNLKSDFYKYRLSLSEREAPIGCLFSQYGEFAGYNLVDGVYLNVHEKFDGTKMFADSSRPMLQVVTYDIDKQTKYGLMFVLLDAFGPAGGWSILLQDWETEQIYPLYAEKAFEWNDMGITVTTAGWQSEYVDLTTGKLKVPYNGTISDIGRSMVYLPGEMEVTEDVLGDYVAGTPFVKLEGVYKWSNLVKNKEETLKLAGNDYKIIQHTSMESLTIDNNNGAENVIILGTIDGTLTIESGAVKQLTYVGYCNHLTIDLKGWTNYASMPDYPVINLIGDGAATINGRCMDITATDSVTVIEPSDGTNVFKWCSIKAGKNIDYRFNQGLKQQISDNNAQLAHFECDRLTIENLTGDMSAVCRLIEGYCNHFVLNGSDSFLKNPNNMTGIGGQSSLILHMPSYTMALNDGCYAQNYAGPGSTLGARHLFAEPDACGSYVYNRQWLTVQDYVDSKSGGSGDYMTSSQVQSLVDNALVSPVSNISSNTERITALEESSGSASGGPNPTVIAKSTSPVDAYDTCSTYGPMYLNRFFADNFDSDETVSGLILMGSDYTGDLICIDYTAHTPSSLHLYVYDGSGGADMSGAITQELYKDGAWVFDPVANSLSSNSSWKVRSDISANAARILNQLLSATTKNGVSTRATSASNAWSYMSLSSVQDGLVPPNVYGEDLDTFYEHSMGTGSLADTSFYTGRPILYQCVWEGNISLGHADYSGFTSARVVFKPIWGGWADSAKITCTSESIGPKTLTLITRYGAVPEIDILGEDGYVREGTLHWKPLYVSKS